jgi:tryptophan synthase beta chain
VSYGDYGGRYVPETLIPALDELERGWREALADASFRAELHHLLTTYAGRPTPLTLAERFAPGKRILKRGASSTPVLQAQQRIGQAVLAQRLGKRQIVAETGAGRSVAHAGLPIQLRVRRLHGRGGRAPPRPNVERMRLLEAEVRGVDGREDAEGGDSEAIRDWIERRDAYCLDRRRSDSPYPSSWPGCGR